MSHLASDWSVITILTSDWSRHLPGSRLLAAWAGVRSWVMTHWCMLTLLVSSFPNNESQSDNESDNCGDERQEMWENSEELWSLEACATIKGCGSYYVELAIIDQSEHLVGDYWPITAQDAHKWSVTASSQFLKTAPSPPGLWLVNIDHVTPVLASDWLIILTLLSVSHLLTPYKAHSLSVTSSFISDKIPPSHCQWAACHSYHEWEHVMSWCW